MVISQLFAQEPAFESLKTIIDLFCRYYPSLRILSFGNSVLGRELYALSLGKGYGASLMTGGINGQAAPSTLLLLQLCERLIFSLKEELPLCGLDVRRILERRGVLIIPCLNPDGLSDAVQERLSFPISNDVQEHCSFARSETQAFAKLCFAASPKRCYTFSSGDRSLEYGCYGHVPPASPLMAEILASSCGYPVIPPAPDQRQDSLMCWSARSLDCPSFQISIQSESGVQPYPRLEEMLLLSLMI